MHKLKTIHLHSDVKFIDDTRSFENDRFANTVIILGEKGTYKGYYEKNALYYRFSFKQLRKIINYCKSADLVILYNLDFSKSFIANRLPGTVKVAWRFFGLELYSKIPDEVFSSLSVMHLEPSNTTWFSYLIKQMGPFKFKQLIKRLEFIRAINRIDSFWGVSDYEYAALKRKWPRLPEFVQLPFHEKETKYFTINKKKNEIIIGNSRNRYNNHLDIIKIITKCRNKDKYDYFVFFSYGPLNNYTKAVRETAADVKKVKFIDEFLSDEEFREVYRNASAFVMNSYRQMAMGNIFTAFRNGVKVYLNKRNIIYDWLIKEGFMIYSVEDFTADIEDNNITLSSEDMKYNINQYHKMTRIYNILDFQSKIYNSNRVDNSTL
ncbi:MAG: hypothetical protein WD491_13100 [Balneolales bacterium]